MTGPGDWHLLAVINATAPWEERSAAWGTLWHRYEPLATRTARRITRNDGLADEALSRVAEKFTTLARGSELRVTTSYSGFLQQQVKYSCLTIIRERRRWVDMPDSRPEEAPPTLVDEGSQETSVATDRIRVMVRDALALLARDGRAGYRNATLLRRRHLDEIPARDVMEELRLPERTFFNHQKDAVKAFRAILKGHFGFDVDDL